MANLPILFQVQTIESRLQALKKDEGQVRNDPQLAQIEMLLKETKLQIADLENKRRSNQSSNRKLELDLKSNQEHQAAENKKLYGGLVTSSRELELIQQKAAEYKTAAGKLEDDILKLLEQDESFGEQLAALRKRQTACEEELATLKVQATQKLREIGITVEGLEIELSEVSVQVPGEWLARYHKIAGAHHGIGIGQVKNGNCPAPAM